MRKKQDDKTAMNGNQEAENQKEQEQQTEGQQAGADNKQEANQAESGEDAEPEQKDQQEAGAEDQDAAEQKDPLQKKQEEYQELYDKHLRLYSEFENFRRRSKKESADAKEKGRTDMVLAVLPVLDDFERALNSISESAESKEVYDGIELIYNKLKNTLNEQGLQEMEPKGKEFDPEYHEAMTKTQAQSEEQKGKVVDVVEKGYMLNDRIVRHAKVVVGE